MELLQISESKLIVSPYALTISEFKAIWDRDTTRAKDKAIKELSFVYFMAAYHSPYRAYEIKERASKIVHDLNMKEWASDDVIKASIVKYEELEVTPTLALLQDVEEGVFKIREFFRTVDIKKDEKGTKVASLIRSMGSIPDVIKSMSILRSQVEKELAIGQVGRAGRQISSREMPPEQRKK